jgi:P4 family phage/plasmid primase-like protien
MNGHNRHEDLHRVMDSLIKRNYDIIPLEKIKQLAREHNTIEFYEEPISDIDFERQWIQAVRFIRSKNEEDSQVTAIKEDPGDERTRVQKLVDSITQEHTFVTMTDNGELYHFNGKMYEPGQEWIIKEKCRLLESKTTTHEVQEVINYIKDSTYKSRALFDSDPDLIVVQNGVLNIHTLELKPHSPKHCALSMLPVIYNPKARCPLFTKFLGKILQPKYVSVMLQFIGYCIYKSAKYEKAALCIGKGDNGKSTFLKWLDGFIGSHNASHASLQELSGGNRFAAADLQEKMINTFADLRSEKLYDTGPFKMLVSGDSIRAEKKYGLPFSFKNYAKLIFSCNDIPQSEDKGYAYFKRWLIFHFDNVFTGEQRDTELFRKISTSEEYSGALNLVLISLRQLIKNNGFTDMDDIEAVKEDYELNSSTVANFIHEKYEITKDERDDILCRVLYDDYVEYCNDNNLNKKSDSVFGQELKLLHVGRHRTTKNYESVYVYTRIKPKTRESETDSTPSTPSSRQQLF